MVLDADLYAILVLLAHKKLKIQGHRTVRLFLRSGDEIAICPIWWCLQNGVWPTWSFRYILNPYYVYHPKKLM